jgi:tetratricopeptide (TPR) repeat protein/GTPase SAR1 family protein
LWCDQNFLTILLFKFVIAHEIDKTDFTQTCQQEARTDRNRNVPSWFINVPSKRTHVGSFFSGRDEDLDRVEKFLYEHTICGVCGQGGVGKTALVVKLAHQLAKQSKFDVVFWIKASSSASFAESVSSISDTVNTKRREYLDSSRQAAEATQDLHVAEKMEELKEWLKIKSESLKILLVIDDYSAASCFENVKTLLPENLLNDRRVHVILTSQESNLDAITVYKVVTLEPLLDKVVVNMLKQRAREQGVKWTNDEKETDSAYEIAKIVGGLPLAVEQVAAYIVKKQMLLSRYLIECRTTQDGQIPVDEPTHGERSSIDTVYKRNFDEISKTEAVKETMGIAAFCSVDPIPIQLLSLGSSGLTERYALRKEADSACHCRKITRLDSQDVPKQFFVVLSELKQYHLIKFDSDSEQFAVHPVIQMQYQCRLSTEERRDSVAALSTLLATVFQGSPADRWQLYRSLFPHIMACCKKMEEMQLYNTNLLLQAGSRLSLSGHFSESSQLLRTFLSEIQRNVHERQTFQEAMGLHALGSAQRRLGEFSDATKNAQQALKIWGSLPKSDSVSRKEAKTKELYAEILLDLNEFSGAEQLLREVEPVMTPNQSNTIDCYELSSYHGNLGRAYAGQEKYEQALEKFTQAAECLEKEEYFRYHLYKAHILMTKGFRFLQSSDYDSYQEVLEKCIETLNEIENYYSLKHRYHSFLRREIAVMQLKEWQKMKDTWSKKKRRQEITTALSMAKTSLEDDFDLYKERHQRVARAAHVAALLCLEFAQEHKKMSSESHEAAFRCLELSVQIWSGVMKDLKSEKFTAISETITELKERQNHVQITLAREKQRMRTIAFPNSKLPMEDSLSLLAKEAIRSLNVLLPKQQNDNGTNLDRPWSEIRNIVLFVTILTLVLFIIIIVVVLWKLYVG